MPLAISALVHIIWYLEIQTGAPFRRASCLAGASERASANSRSTTRCAGQLHRCGGGIEAVFSVVRR